MRMQNNIHTWADVWEMLRMWWNGDVPLGGVVLSIVITILRVAYSGGGRKKMWIEAALCGALTLTAVSSLEYFELPKTLTMAIGGGIGFIGVEQIRSVALRILGTRFGGNKPQA
ncbi:phage holin, lambda family [Dickeya solani]|uniref:Phage holin, lambda family n=1 Tax=Dickeya solani TaxID=1089444 RepID=A0ABU4EIS9_9GAMM|nr:phage holin, lambda family [Dickeya solani]MCZ0823695.1 phage holin, lambda family [Dickeya solani]MDV6995602.1 phage holin, lambda family [Dickeya solani]MDV7002881.1 phage holin, lambda family [Dickeya solani]MDV7036657.1 phage holin, lambda family [Dickeya solani]MDV7043410.1 phage holin, lambda family [Dickeya solani]